MSAKANWKLEADYLQACNCDYGCPCEFSAPPTTGFCQGILVWRINRGSHGATSLDGLGAGLAAHWPKAIHEGNGTVCAFVDETANPAQRDALMRILSGQDGGMPFELLAMTFAKRLEPKIAKFQFKINGLNSAVTIGDLLHVSMGPILNPVTKQPESVSVNHASGFVFKEAECASAEEFSVNAGELKYSWPKKAAFIGKITYSN
jgi:hypothetical protein